MLTADLIRAGDFADRVSFYRHDLNFRLPGVPPNPHAYFNTINAANPNYYRVMLGRTAPGRLIFRERWSHGDSSHSDRSVGGADQGAPAERPVLFTEAEMKS